MMRNKRQNITAFTTHDVERQEGRGGVGKMLIQHTTIQRKEASPRKKSRFRLQQVNLLVKGFEL